MTTAQLETIIQEAPEKLRVILGELEPHILVAAANALSESEDTEGGGKPKVSVPLTLVIELNQSPPAWSVKGAVGVRYTACSETEQLEETPELIEGMGKSSAPKRSRKTPPADPATATAPQKASAPGGDAGDLTN